MRWRNTRTRKEIKVEKYIDRFNDVEQIEKCAEYYINLLGLQDWKILFVLGPTKDENNAGECESIFEEKCAKITIADKVFDDLWFKQPQELILIHELIHCKIELYNNDRLEGLMIYQAQHTLIDDWARSIFYARYKLSNKDMYW